MDKRSFIKTGIVGIGALVVSPLLANGQITKLSDKYKPGKFRLPDLPYPYDALKPYLDTKTMTIHHSMHHAGYAERFKEAVREAGISGKSAGEILKEVSKYPLAVRNYGGGYVNHKIYWKVMSPKGGGRPTGNLLKAINNSFSSFEKFKDEFSAAAKSKFGSGWAWLIVADGKLKITSTSNQDNPVMDIAEVRGYPILCIDVWEHAYYLKYKNRRSDYIEAFWNVINWNTVAYKFNKAML